MIEIWLQSLVMHLSSAGPLPRTLLADILQYARGAARPSRGHATPECCQHAPDNGIFCLNDAACCQCGELQRSPSAAADWSAQGVVKVGVD